MNSQGAKQAKPRVQNKNIATDTKKTEETEKANPNNLEEKKEQKEGKPAELDDANFPALDKQTSSKKKFHRNGHMTGYA
eukprot:CAMPEP_0178884392 /NCGR_PEP_ID=MMETSP0747-20121128/14690_1 /TAXON_ID=913974 /ORGANISM="Nitzschia punctata, Strain CCMP561" /LENGTH=78 /DNA_ID=CAMNT_0020552785 /DNA_START=60 /DNA_END=294 /DNA_ORIENTATION=+